MWTDKTVDLRFSTSIWDYGNMTLILQISTQYGDGAGHTAEDNSSIFSLTGMC